MSLASLDEARRQVPLLGGGGSRRSVGGWRLAVRALGQAVVTSAIVVVITFFLIRAVPGDPARAILGLDAPQEAVNALRIELGLDAPVLTQFAVFAGDLVRGDLGMSMLYPELSVSTLVFRGLGHTALLAVTAIAVSVVAGFILGLIAAMTRYKAVDGVIRFIAMITLAAPAALVCLLLILVVAVRAGLAPAGGWAGEYPDNLRYLWLPVVALSALLTPVILRAVRQRAKVVLEDLHIEAAVARGISPVRLVVAHVIPNCALPIITIVGLTLGELVGGAALIEAVFGIPGLGSTMVNAIGGRDYPVVQGVTVVTAVAVVLANVLAETVQRGLDPRGRT